MTIEFDGQNNKLGTTTANSVTIKTNDTDAVTIDTSQNVGVGTASPSQKLEVNGNVQIDGVILVETANNNPLQIESTDAFCGITLADTGGSAEIEVGATGDLIFKSGGDASTPATNATEAMRIQNDQQVGVGTQDPSAKFHVANANAATQFKLEHTSATNPVVFGNDSSSNLRIYTGGTEKIRIDSSGHAIITNGVTLGTTGLAYDANNTLDDYEEGTWTPSFEFSSTQPTAGNTTGTGFYTKVGNMVTVWGACSNVNVTGAGGDARVRDLPFTSKSSANLVGWMGSFSVHGNTTFNGYVNCDVQDGFGYIRPLENQSGGSRDILNTANFVHGTSDVYFSVSYQVN